MHVHGVDLPAGTVSFGHFWTDRFYNVYHWLDADRRTHRVLLQHRRPNADRGRPSSSGAIWWSTCWRPRPGGSSSSTRTSCPRSLDAEAAAHIAAGKAAILGAPAVVMAEIEAASRALFPLVFPDRPQGSRARDELDHHGLARDRPLSENPSTSAAAGSRPAGRDDRPADAASAPTTVSGATPRSRSEASDRRAGPLRQPLAARRDHQRHVREGRRRRARARGRARSAAASRRSRSSPRTTRVTCIAASSTTTASW